MHKATIGMSFRKRIRLKIPVMFLSGAWPPDQLPVVRLPESVSEIHRGPALKGSTN